MAANPTLHEDLALFRRLLQVMNVVQKEDTLDQCGAPTSSKDYQPVFKSGVKRRRSEMDFQEEVMTEGSESDDEDDDDDDIQDVDTEEEDTEDDEEEDYEEEEEDYDEEEALDFDNEDSSSSSESDTLYDNHDDEPTLPFSPPSSSSTSPNIYPAKPPPPPPSTSPSSPRHNPNPTTPPPPLPNAQTQPPTSSNNDLRCHDHSCNGRLFTTRSNLQRHRREKSRATRLQCRCPRCGAVFSRTTARNTHVARGSCHRIRRYSNGRVRKGERVRD